MRILVKVPPTPQDKWTLSFGSGSRKRNSASVILNAIERRLRGYVLKEKTTIKVKYSKDTTNTTIPSLDTNYLLYAVGCFLEDYLSGSTLLRLQRNYGSRASIQYCNGYPVR